MTLSVLTMKDIQKPEEVGKFEFTLLSLVEGKTKTLIEPGFSILYKIGKQLDDTRRIQASTENYKRISTLF
ncbi:hypothetical protein MYX76_05750 [Desulfobacterota bacterium AH_259_B03_O07]|nr:hypothetical protein [Desulfobacterota bacterium AH_259_B03_O07]